jgi:hypothetical protein
MKHLKKFEDLDVSENRSKEEIQSHLDEIKSVFQEYIDDFDIEELPADLEADPHADQEDDDSVSGLFYHLYKRRGMNLLLFQFDFYLYDNEDGDFINKFIRFLEFKDEIKKSLTSRGYDVSYRCYRPRLHLRSIGFCIRVLN